MAQDPHELQMSLLLDGLLDGESEQEMLEIFQTSSNLEKSWEHMRAVDAILKNAPPVMPSVNFTAGVMARIERYDARQRSYPIIMGIVIGLSVIVALSFALPVLFFTLDLHIQVLQIPWVAGLIREIVTVYQGIVWVITGASALIADWYVFISTDPAALAIVLTGLVMASIWIGLRESQKVMVSLSLEAQSQTA